MTEAKTKSVNMTFPALFSYVMNTNYRSMSGILGLVLSFGAIVMLVIGWNNFWQTEGHIYHCGIDVYRDQSALACVQDIQAVEDKPFV